MIKRIRLATRKSGLGREEFAGRLRDAAMAAALAPEPARPARLTISVAVPEVDADQAYDGAALEWFTDDDHLRRFEAWLSTRDGQAVPRLLGAAADLQASPVVVSDERVVRGADWLETRWRQGGPKLKQLAIAKRADGLTLAQFLDLWRSRAGKLGAAPIPEEFRGLAYVQNHPRPTAGTGGTGGRPPGEWPGGAPDTMAGLAIGRDPRDWDYDAVNEVYFDDVAGLVARIAYFARELTGTAESDLISENWFLAVRQEPVAPSAK